MPTTKVSPGVLTSTAKAWEWTQVIINPANGVIPISLGTHQKQTITQITVQYVSSTLSAAVTVDSSIIADYGTLAVTATKTAYTGSVVVPQGSTLALSLTSVVGTGTFAITIWGITNDS